MEWGAHVLRQPRYPLVKALKRLLAILRKIVFLKARVHNTKLLEGSDKCQHRFAFGSRGTTRTFDRYNYANPPAAW